jgi:hypothetical protein
MSNAVKSISAALGYDAVETMLASGAPLSSAYAFAAVEAGNWSVGADASPASTRAATLAPATVRPGKAA